MCVIFAVTGTKRPTEDMISKAYEANPSGAGIAWRQDGKVFWKKGLDLAEITELCKTTPLPYVAHFRIPSTGGKHDSLCHPFPIDRRTSDQLEGSTKGYVLFHNGHWTKWRDVILETAVNFHVPIPRGKWSDTRALAWATAIYGLGLLDIVDEKTVAFGPDDMEFTTGTGWYEEPEKGSGLWCSNVTWKSTKDWSNWVGNRSGGFTMCKEMRCVKPREPGSEFCKEHIPIDVKIEEIKSSKPLPSAGGQTNNLPFAEVTRQFNEAREEFTKGKLSKNKFKKIRKTWERARSRAMETSA